MESSCYQHDSVLSTDSTLVVPFDTLKQEYPLDHSKPCLLDKDASEAVSDVRSVISKAKSELLKQVNLDVTSKCTTAAPEDVEEGELTILGEVVSSDHQVD